MPLVFRVSSAVGKNLPLTHYTMMLSEDFVFGCHQPLDWDWSLGGEPGIATRSQMFQPIFIFGSVVALALIPEAIAFSIIAGVDPKVGLSVAQLPKFSVTSKLVS